MPAPVLVMHSLGELLEERDAPVGIAGLVLVATPFWGESDWQPEWALAEGWPDPSTRLPPIFLFHTATTRRFPSPISSSMRSACQRPRLILSTEAATSSPGAS